METLTLTCPFCSVQKDVPHGGGYAPQYTECAGCGRRYIYEPVLGGVRCLDPLDADCCSDPECRAREMGASGED